VVRRSELRMITHSREILTNLLASLSRSKPKLLFAHICDSIREEDCNRIIKRKEPARVGGSSFKR